MYYIKILYYQSASTVRGILRLCYKFRLYILVVFFRLPFAQLRTQGFISGTVSGDKTLVPVVQKTISLNLD